MRPDEFDMRGEERGSNRGDKSIVGLTVRASRAVERVSGGAVMTRHAFRLLERMLAAREAARPATCRLVARDGPGKQRERRCQQSGDQSDGR